MRTGLPFSPLSPLAFLRRSAAVYPDRVAIVDGDTRLTYAQFGVRVGRVAGALRERGLRPGGRVAALGHNSLPMLDAHYGAPLAGGAVVPLNTRLSAAELAAIVDHSGAGLMIAGRELDELAAEVAARVEAPLEILVESEGYEALIARADEVEIELPDESAVLSINYTSGTTGNPKGVMYHHRGAYLQALAMAFHSRLGAESRYLWTLPMFHCHGWSFVWAVTGAGGRHVCLRSTAPADIWASIEAEEITHMCAAPTVLTSMVEEGGSPAGRVQVFAGGSPPTPTLLAELDELGLSVAHLYGLTETFGPVGICDWHPEWDGESLERRAALMARQGVGNLVADALDVVDEAGASVPADGEALGEVVVRGNTVMLGYYRDPEATAEALAGGVFHTGDLGVLHPDGYVELRDRSKDMILSGGENIASIEVEQALASHPAVLEVAVVAMPDEKWGERPFAFVVTRPGMAADDADLDAHVRERLAGYKAPSGYEFREALPKTGTGKLRKRDLREEIAGRVSVTSMQTDPPGE